LALDLWLAGLGLILLACFYRINDPHTLYWNDWLLTATIVGFVHYMGDRRTWPASPAQKT
jgi:hypothetical protein